MSSPEAREVLPQVDKIILFWNHILPPSYEKLSARLGFEVRRPNIIKWSRTFHPEDNSSKKCLEDIKNIISEFGIPKAIVLTHSNEEPFPGRKAVSNFAGKQEIPFFYIPSESLLPPDLRE